MGDEEKALAEKQLGNDAYKKKDFDAAIGHYSKVRNLNYIRFRTHDLRC